MYIYHVVSETPRYKITAYITNACFVLSHAKYVDVVFQAKSSSIERVILRNSVVASLSEII